MVASGANQSGIIASLWEIGDFSNGFTLTRRMWSSNDNLQMANNGASLTTTGGSLPSSAGFSYRILEGVKNYGSNSALYINGIQDGRSSDATLNGSFTNANYHIGKSTSYNYLNGDIAEVIVYNRALSDSDRKGVEQYLFNKYGNGLNQTGTYLWADQSGNGHNAGQTVAALEPQLVTNQLNGYPIYRFNGTSNVFNGDTISGLDNSSLSFFLVAKGYAQSGTLAAFFEAKDSASGLSIARHLYFSGSLSVSNNSNDGYGGIPLLETSSGSFPNSGFPYTLMEGVKNLGSLAKLYINGSLAASSTNSNLTGPFTNDNYRIGKAVSWNYLNGDIAEMIIYSSSLSDSDRQNVENYLNTKYHIY